jgi:hypothetical protein
MKILPAILVILAAALADAQTTGTPIKSYATLPATCQPNTVAMVNGSDAVYSCCPAGGAGCTPGTYTQIGGGGGVVTYTGNLNDVPAVGAVSGGVLTQVVDTQIVVESTGLGTHGLGYPYTTSTCTGSNFGGCLFNVDIGGNLKAQTLNAGQFGNDGGQPLFVQETVGQEGNGVAQMLDPEGIPLFTLYSNDDNGGSGATLDIGKTGDAVATTIYGRANVTGGVSAPSAGLAYFNGSEQDGVVLGTTFYIPCGSQPGAPMTVFTIYCDSTAGALEGSYENGTFSKFLFSNSSPGLFPTLNQSTTGNAATATALASAPTLCSSGQAPTGVLASGNATGCTAYATSGYLKGTTGSIGGSALLAGACASGTASITGVAAGTPCTAACSTGIYLTSSVAPNVYALGTASGTATVYVCAIVAITPTACTYAVSCMP